MKFSLITPSHRLTYINELYESIKAQTHTDWEWIIYLNGGLGYDELSNDITNDARVVVTVDVSGDDRVGYLKKQAFSLGTGDVLVEMDHDDLLIPTCLERLAEAYQDAEVGFVYSDNAKLPMDGKFTPYTPRVWMAA